MLCTSPLFDMISAICVQPLCYTASVSSVEDVTATKFTPADAPTDVAETVMRGQTCAE